MRFLELPSGNSGQFARFLDGCSQSEQKFLFWVDPAVDLLGVWLGEEGSGSRVASRAERAPTDSDLFQNVVSAAVLEGGGPGGGIG